MHKHLTPQEIEEFERRFGYISNRGVQCDSITKEDILSFIDTLIGKRVGEKFEDNPSVDHSGANHQ